MTMLNRVWMATSVVFVQGQPDQCSKWRKSVIALGQRAKALYRSDRPEPRCVAAALKRQACYLTEHQQRGESIGKVMLINCWAHG